MVAARAGLFAAVLAIATGVCAGESTDVETILALETPPAGVVLEILTVDEQGLNWALPVAQEHIDRLRERFPALPIAIVSHGEEQFALATKVTETRESAQQAARELAAMADVTVHVCGTLAGWNGLSDRDFPAFVNVSAAAPAQINDYRELGYAVIRVHRP